MKQLFLMVDKIIEFVNNATQIKGIYFEIARGRVGLSKLMLVSYGIFKICEFAEVFMNGFHFI